MVFSIKKKYDFPSESRLRVTDRNPFPCFYYNLTSLSFVAVSGLLECLKWQEKVSKGKNIL